jgi:hypothetical protein
MPLLTAAMPKSAARRRAQEYSRLLIREDKLLRLIERARARLVHHHVELLQIEARLEALRSTLRSVGRREDVA